MQKGFNKYETEIRLGLFIIVALLLFMNFTTTYLFNRVRVQVSEEIDGRLSAAVKNAGILIARNQNSGLSQEQIIYLKRQYSIENIKVSKLPGAKPDSQKIDFSNIIRRDQNFPELDQSAIEELLGGHQISISGKNPGVQYGLTVIKASQNTYLLITAQADSRILESINRAFSLALYPAVIILSIITLLTIILPRMILKPFKKMRQTAAKAGRLKDIKNDDDVSQVIKTYEESIGELKRNETELKKLYEESSHKANHLEKLNRCILKSIGSGAINVDLTGKVMGYNRAASNILGYEEKNVLGKYYLNAFQEETEINLMIESGLERGESICRRELQIPRGNGCYIWLGIESSQIYDEEGNVLGVTLLFTDLSELKELQSELEINRQMAALGEMASGLAHQLRNSMASISGFSQLLQKKTESDSPQGEIAGSIRDESMASEQMVRRFLDFSKPLSLNLDEINFKDIIIESLDKSKDIIENNNINIGILDIPANHSIIGDQLLLREAISNIIENAIQAVDTNGNIRIKYECSDTNTYLSIIDDGCGINENIRDKIFTPFVSSKPSGTGLGLALARKIINLHEGSISFQANAGGGTICQISLPIAYKANNKKDAESANFVRNM